jgi:hypothetical protein
MAAARIGTEILFAALAFAKQQKAPMNRDSASLQLQWIVGNVRPKLSELNLKPGR